MIDGYGHFKYYSLSFFFFCLLKNNYPANIIKIKLSAQDRMKLSEVIKKYVII